MEHRRSWKLPALFAIAAIVSVGAAVAVGRATAAPSHSSHHGGAQTSVVSTGTPGTANVMQALCAGHAQEMQAWRDKYAADPTGVEAARALQALHREHHQEMIAAFARLGVKPPVQACGAVAGSMMDGSASGMMNGSAGGMMGGFSVPAMMGGAPAGASHAQHHGGNGSGAAGGCGSPEGVTQHDMMRTVTS